MWNLIWKSDTVCTCASKIQFKIDKQQERVRKSEWTHQDF